MTAGHTERIPAAPQPSLETRQGIEALEYLTIHGMPIKEFYKPGADADAATYSAAAPTEQGKRYKVYIRGRFLVLDIDRNHQNGGDGLENLYRHLESIGKPRALLPAFMRDIDQGRFPFYTQTPSGGLHLYFRYNGRYVTGSLAPDVEVKNLQVSAGWKAGKPYILHGEIENAPLVPAFMLENIMPPKTEHPGYRPSWQEKKEWGRPSWALLVAWTDRDNQAGMGRNNRAYSLAVHAACHNWNKEDTLAALQGEPSIGGLPLSEITSAVDSAYKRRQR
jgi:hypothetical protein